MRRRDAVLLVVALLIAAGCVRLGIWQLQRLAERRAHNETALAAFQEARAPLAAIRGDPAELRFRPVTVTGRYDHDNELVLANRPRRGSPGVYLLTPLRAASSDTAVLVLRGWIYSPDATHADAEPWREDSADAAVGYVQVYDEVSAGQRGRLQDRILSRLTYEDAAAAVPYPLAPYLVVLTESADTVSGAPPRLDVPVLGEGSHLSYAFQWFAFAAIALAGTAVFLWHSSRGRTARPDRFEVR